jgi:hypothetical protein
MTIYTAQNNVFALDFGTKVLAAAGASVEITLKPRQRDRYILSQIISRRSRIEEPFPEGLITVCTPTDTRNIRDLSVPRARHGDLRDPGAAGE